MVSTNLNPNAMKKHVALFCLVCLTQIACSQNYTICLGSCVGIQSTPPSTNNILYTSPTVSISPNASGIFVVCPSVSTTYTLKASATSTIQSVRQVIVMPNPTIFAAASLFTICTGQSTTLTANGAASYSWSNGATTNQIVVSPAGTTNYTVTGVDLNGCAGSAVLSINVNTISISAPPITICTGQPGTLTASGATSYFWSNGMTTNSIVESPSVTTNYTVTGGNAQGCYQSITTQIAVSSSPAITVNSAAICPGNSATLVANGINTYTWSNGTNSSSIIVSPASNTLYTISGGLAGCPGTASASAPVLVNPNPTLSIAGNSSVCLGSSLSQTVSGALTYTWSNNANTAIISVTPSVTSIYSVTGTNSSGCTGSAFAGVAVVALPNLTITATPTVCAGSAATIAVSGASTYTWSSGATGAEMVVTPTIISNPVYSVTGLSSAGCSNTIQVTLHVSACLRLGSSESITADLILFPNPAKEACTIRCPDAEKFRLRITDITGALVLENSSCLNDHPINIQFLKAGTYFVFIQNEHQAFTRKLIVEE